MDKGNVAVIDSKFKSKGNEQVRDSGPHNGQSTSTQRTSNITCFKCQGRGHYARGYANQRVMMLLPIGEYESSDEQGEVITEPDESTEYPEVGELLIIRRVLRLMVNP